MKSLCSMLCTIQAVKMYIQMRSVDKFVDTVETGVYQCYIFTVYLAAHLTHIRLAFTINMLHFVAVTYPTNGSQPRNIWQCIITIQVTHHLI